MNAPVPWRTFNSYADSEVLDGGPDQVHDAEGQVVAYIPASYYGKAAHAERIVLAVNCHDDLMEALRELERTVTAEANAAGSCSGALGARLTDARAALKKAGVAP